MSGQSGVQRSQLGRRGEAARAELRKQLPVSTAGMESTEAIDVEETAPRHAVLESALVKNLKKQITCLEMEVAVLKGTFKKEAELTGAATGDTRAAEAPRDVGFAPADTVPSATHARVHPSTLWVDGSEKEALRRESPYSANAESLRATAQRLLHDNEALEVRLQCEQQERQKLSMENDSLLLALRESCSNAEETHRRLREALGALNTEQKKRREMEDKLRVFAGSLLAEEDAECREDVFSEKEYYRVQTDRLRVAQQDSLARIEKLEKQLKTERTQAAEVESRLCAALEEVRRLSGLASEKTGVYESLDKGCTGMCAILQMAVDDCDRLQHQLRQCQSDVFSPASSVSIDETLRGLEQISFTLKKEAVDKVSHEDGGKASKELSLGSADKATEEAAFPPPPAATVPPPPEATVPPPPEATVPPPPAATVPPPPAATVSTLVVAIEPAKVQEIPLHNTIDDELEAIERRIREEEASLLAYLNIR
ncbi:hypothetical protein TraAM80_09731 [Trypanosoma rangeli]|uniref:Uncharacterized protein n=1 Tax=Trypanosoma rangeli TaxID=5698 RepID=A0A3R7JTN0_TRYRA|nr:uncharacterized protein TraAM80_09731 [Trypanosoma rangeli]RNE96666.1 hypothetical protein TraAM80_09731 [Trypanosoma rangeli]|eukprot:RNE96666.1 hypothetical protein TraAM80_09731 [Trypanosoma rangeli]